MAIEMVSKVDTFCIFVLFVVSLAAAGAMQYGAGSRRWRRTVASGLALDMLHWAMRLYPKVAPP